MILILSAGPDVSTDDVLEWIHYFKGQAIRVDATEKVTGLTIEIDPHAGNTMRFDVEIGHEKHINFEKIEAFWFRRGNFKYDYAEDFENELSKVNTFYSGLNLFEFMEREWEVLNQFFLQNLANKKRSLSHPKNTNINKLQQLLAAHKAGLKIPYTLVSTKKEQLLKDHHTMITKALYDPTTFKIEDITYKTYTAKLPAPLKKSLDNTVFPSYIQEELDKAYELRVFYLAGKCYSLAIFSQSNKKTRVDFRAYDRQRPNRMVPYQLPGDIEEKINLLMNMLQLNTGSIDLVVTKNGAYYFLEVNPRGQFGMISYPCNYRIEKEIARFLMQLN